MKKKLFFHLFLFFVCMIALMIYIRTAVKFNFDTVTYIDYSWHGKSKRLVTGTEEYNKVADMILSSNYKFHSIKFFSKGSDYIFYVHYDGSKSNELLSLNGENILNKGNKYYKITLNNFDFDYLKQIITE